MAASPGRLQTARLLSLGALWGSSYIFIDLALDSIPAQVVAFGRQLLAGVALLPLVIGPWRRREFVGLRPRLILVSVVMVGAPSLLIALGQRHISASLAAILVATTPLLTAIIARRLGWTPSSYMRVIGLMLGIVGVALLFGLDLRGSPAELLGASLVLLAAVGYAVGGFLVAATFTHVRPLALTGATSMVSAGLLLPTVATSTDIAAHATRSSILALIVLGLGGTAAGWWLYYGLLADGGPEVATLAQYLAPAFAVGLGTTLLGDDLTAAKSLGLTAIVSGSYLVSRQNRLAQQSSSNVSQNGASNRGRVSSNTKRK